LTSCWKKQDIAINPPLHPVYTLSGIVTHEATGEAVNEAEVSVTMTELYQGDFLDSMGTITDQAGYYEISGLYRGRYDILVMSGLDTLFLSELGIIKYEDKVYNILIAAPDSTDAE
ncbi:MAG: carboxypeptidase-like regulatory domain-containing protein, partial [Candidatus Marinimicrobia bacterium]|nr:carboxypeptidase-like regulatory domain-containing protein [Candidatus Neomarinimicrobiota bacterium]